MLPGFLAQFDAGALSEPPPRRAGPARPAVVPAPRGARSAGIVTVHPTDAPPPTDAFRMIADFRRAADEGGAAYWLMRDTRTAGRWQLMQGSAPQVLSDVLDAVNALTGGGALPPRYSDVLLERVRVRLGGFRPSIVTPPALGPGDNRLTAAWLKCCLFLAYGGPAGGNPDADVVLPETYELPEYMGPDWELPEPHEFDVEVTHSFTGAGYDPMPFPVLRGRVTVEPEDHFDPPPPEEGGGGGGGGGGGSSSSAPLILLGLLGLAAAASGGK